MTSSSDNRPQLSRKLLHSIAALATELAQWAGTQITAAYGKKLAVTLKPDRRGTPHGASPVSALDVRVETAIRRRVRSAHPAHALIGEELAAQSGADEFTWIIDPLDGTTNYLNGLPLFACSIGVVWQGLPIVGAIWCSSTHRFGPGVYHAHHGDRLRLDGRAVRPRPSGQWRSLACQPGAQPLAADAEPRVLGCAAVELAYVAAGLMSIAYIPGPRIWDVAGGLMLLEAAGARVGRAGDPPDTMLYLPQSAADLARWSEPLLAQR
ncbi:MAG: inositol monophosphatase [Sinobacteraceae bacterium]|nr:inositol monophosphatase [Nevskiaceae bacterium]